MIKHNQGGQQPKNRILNTKFDHSLKANATPPYSLSKDPVETNPGNHNLTGAKEGQRIRRVSPYQDHNKGEAFPVNSFFEFQKQYKALLTGVTDPYDLNKHDNSRIYQYENKTRAYAKPLIKQELDKRNLEWEIEDYRYWSYPDLPSDMDQRHVYITRASYADNFKNPLKKRNMLQMKKNEDL